MRPAEPRQTAVGAQGRRAADLLPIRQGCGSSRAFSIIWSWLPRSATRVRYRLKATDVRDPLAVRPPVHIIAQCDQGVFRRGGNGVQQRVQHGRAAVNVADGKDTHGFDELSFFADSLGIVTLMPLRKNGPGEFAGAVFGSTA